MSVTLHMDTEPFPVLRWEFDGRWTVEQLEAAVACYDTVTDGVEAFAVLVHVTKEASMPLGGLKALSTLMRGGGQQDPRQKAFVFVSESTTARIMMDVLGRVVRILTGMHFVKDLDTAYAVLEKHFTT